MMKNKQRTDKKNVLSGTEEYEKFREMAVTCGFSSLMAAFMWDNLTPRQKKDVLDGQKD